MPSFIKGVGPLNARIMLIGEAGGEVEDQLAQPFVGPSGRLLDRWWNALGHYRREFRIDNVYPYRPVDNDLKTIPKEELARWTEDLHDRIAALTDPWVLVPTGNTALKALIGKDRITRWRGSILSYTDRNGRAIKVIPTLHPAATFRMPSLERRIRIDWARIFSDSEFRELRLPQRTHIIHPNKKLIVEMYEACKAQAQYIACDIETPGGVMTCIGFAWGPNLSITIPVDDPDYWPNSADREWALAMVNKFLQLAQPKIFQNGLFDTYWLALYGITVRNYIYDTMCLHHCLDATDTHSLHYMASVDTREPYWKDEAKDPEESRKYTRDKNVFWTYNGKDAAVSHELFGLYWQRVQEKGLEDFYYQNYTAMLKPLGAMQLNGIKMDDRVRRRRLATLMGEIIDIEDSLEKVAGYRLRAKKTLSQKRISKFLYQELKLPRIINMKTKELTTNEVALRRLRIRVGKRISQQQMLIRAHKYGARSKDMQRATRDIAAWQTGVKVLNLLLEHRRKYQLTTFLPDARLDEDQKMRCQFNFTTETGRLSSSKNPTRTGGNLQNIDREYRDLFLPNDGQIFLEIDLSQVEWRIMAILTRNEEMMQLARSLPHEFDIHTYNASLIYNITEQAVTKEQRNVSKRAVHATSYGMHGARLSEILLLDGYIREADECQAMIDVYLEHFPAILDWQERIRKRIDTTRMLTNSWGRTIYYKYDRINDDLYRRGYSYIPQSDNAQLLNNYGLIPVYHYLTKNRMRSSINVQVHDSLLISAHVKEAYDIAKFAVQSLERAREYEGNVLAVPCGIKLGHNWKGDHEFKKFPTRTDFNAVAFDIYDKMYAQAA